MTRTKVFRDFIARTVSLSGSLFAKLGAVIVAAAIALPAAAQNFPNRTIRIIVPYQAAWVYRPSTTS